jgi:hypothetical protein
MIVKEVKEIAQGLGIPLGKMKKNELIKTIQETEGNFPCFGTADSSCDQMQCRWRSDCLK